MVIAIFWLPSSAEEVNFQMWYNEQKSPAVAVGTACAVVNYNLHIELYNRNTASYVTLRFCYVRFPCPGFLVGLCLQIAVSYLSKSDR